MGVSHWVVETAEHTRSHGIYGLKNAYHEFMKGVLSRLGRYWNYGDDIYKDDWDALIVLDACRADLLTSVADEYEFLETPDEHHISNASTSEEWMKKNLKSRPEQTEDIWYVSANPNDTLLDDDAFAGVTRVWEDRWDESTNTTLPSEVTDAAIRTHRRDPDSRLLVHYMQPHEPFVPSDRRGAFVAAQRGELSDKQLWEEYQDNLRYVLDDVRRLLKNIDAETVILTADHGEAINDLGVYGHRNTVPIDGLKRVPWCKTSATNTGQDDVVDESEESSDELSVEEKLQALGYKVAD